MRWSRLPPALSLFHWSTKRRPLIHCWNAPTTHTPSPTWQRCKNSQYTVHLFPWVLYETQYNMVMYGTEVQITDDVFFWKIIKKYIFFENVTILRGFLFLRYLLIQRDWSYCSLRRSWSRVTASLVDWACCIRVSSLVPSWQSAAFPRRTSACTEYTSAFNWNSCSKER